VQVATKTDEIAGTLKICLPTAETGVVARLVVGFEALGKLCVLSVKNSRVRDDWFVLRSQRRWLLARRERHEAARIGPARWRIFAFVSNHTATNTSANDIALVATARTAANNTAANYSAANYSAANYSVSSAFIRGLLVHGW
jgi:hypothetical protein